MTDTASVSVRLLDLAPQQGTGGLVATAVVVIETSGIEFIIQGIMLREHGRSLHVNLPKFKDTLGRRCAAILLPQPVAEAIRRMVREVWRERAARARPSLAIV